MARPAPTNKTLQVRMLQSLANSAEPINRTTLITLASLSHDTFKTLRDDAITLGLIATTPGPRKTLLHAITPAGRGWLARKTGTEDFGFEYHARVAAPRTHCYMDVPYVPDQSVYVRNAGLKHIKSKGI